MDEEDTSVQHLPVESFHPLVLSDYPVLSSHRASEPSVAGTVLCIVQGNVNFS